MELEPVALTHRVQSGLARVNIYWGRLDAKNFGFWVP